MSPSNQMSFLPDEAVEVVESEVATPLVDPRQYPPGLPINQIVHGDCVAKLNALPAESIDLIFADPPFNIGYKYDVYQDSLEHQQYLDWSRQWIAAVHRGLKADGTFWLAIGDEYAAELKVISQEVGFHCRSWVIWYYTFGVNCSQKFTRSHAHLFHFVKDPKRFTFRSDELDNRVPSARELVYNDRRANPQGRLPDDTWILPPVGAVDSLQSSSNTFVLRPQELEQGFAAEEDTWYIPRVAGTFKERAGFHGCQMPEQLLGRIIRTCSEPDDVVVDPFSGSATTLAVAKKLGRAFLGFDLSEEYVAHGRARLATIAVGDRLDGTPEPLKTQAIPQAPSKRRLKGDSSSVRAQEQRDAAVEQRYQDSQRALTQRAIVQAFRESHDGYSVDHVILDYERNAAFINRCRERALVGEPRTWNMLLLRMRRLGWMLDIVHHPEATFEFATHDAIRFAGEIALRQTLGDAGGESLEAIFCDPEQATQFDDRAAAMVGSANVQAVRWAAVAIRNQAVVAQAQAGSLVAPQRWSEKQPIQDFDALTISDGPAIYIMTDDGGTVWYVGETENLRARLTTQFATERLPVWQAIAEGLSIQSATIESSVRHPLAWQSCLLQRCQQLPPLNYSGLA